MRRSPRRPIEVARDPSRPLNMAHAAAMPTATSASDREVRLRAREERAALNEVATQADGVSSTEGNVSLPAVAATGVVQSEGTEALSIAVEEAGVEPAASSRGAQLSSAPRTPERPNVSTPERPNVSTSPPIKLVIDVAPMAVSTTGHIVGAVAANANRSPIAPVIIPTGDTDGTDQWASSSSGPVSPLSVPANEIPRGGIVSSTSPAQVPPILADIQVPPTRQTRSMIRAKRARQTRSMIREHQGKSLEDAATANDAAVAAAAARDLDDALAGSSDESNADDSADTYIASPHERLQPVGSVPNMTTERTKSQQKQKRVTRATDESDEWMDEDGQEEADGQDDDDDWMEEDGEEEKEEYEDNASSDDDCESRPRKSQKTVGNTVKRTVESERKPNPQPQPTRKPTGRPNAGRKAPKKPTTASDEPEDSDASDDSELDVSIPLDVLRYAPPAQTKGEFAYGLALEFESWAAFHTAVEDFEQVTYQLFKTRTSKSAKNRNDSVKTNDYLIPATWDKYAKTLKCTHGMRPQFKKKKKSGKNERKRRSVRYTGCTATINATVVPMASVSGFGVRWTASGGHNHDLSALLYRYYVENRLVKTPGMLKRVGAWMRTGSNAQGILHEIRRETGRACGIRDVRNMIAQIKREQIAGTTVEERLATNLEEFVASEGNSALVHVSEDSREAESVVFQSAGQKRLFAAFPEVVLVDCTHSTNRSRFILFSFVVHDVFGKGQYVNHALLHRETMDNMADSVTAFKANNPTWSAIRAFIVDKDFKERTILREHFADARILLCHYHVIKYFAKKVKALVRGTKNEKDEILHVLRALVYAKSRELYDALKILLAKRLSALMSDEDMGGEVEEEEEDMLSEDGDDDDSQDDELEDDTDDFAGAALRSAREDAEVARGRQHIFYRYFLKNWETCVEEWALFLRQNVAHLGNNTNNRIEAKWGAMKKVIKANMDMEQTVRGIRSLQEASEDEYLRQLVELRQPIDYSNDEELAKLIDMVSEHAFKLIEVEYTAVKNGSVHYSVRDVGTNAVLVSSSPSGLGSTEHTVDGQNFKCSCFFAQVRLLPCRHVFFYRTYKSLETVIPFGFIHRRWSVRSPVNNISSGVVFPGKYVVKSARATATNKMGEGAKFCKVIAVLKPIASAIAAKTEIDFNQLYTMCIKIGNLVQRGITPKIEDVPSDDEAIGGQSEGEAGNAKEGTAQESTSNNTSATPATPATPETTSDQHKATFVLPPVAELRSTRKNMKTSDAATQLARIQDEAVKFYLRTSTQGRVFSLSDVQDRLEHTPYTYEDALTVVAGVPILATTTASTLVRKLPEHTVAAPATIRFVLQEKVLTRLREKLYEAIDGQAIDVAYDEHIVKVGDGKGYLGVGSLMVMDNFFVALGHVHAVIVATEWVKKLNFATCRDLGAPFNSMGNPSADFTERTVTAIKHMPLAGLQTAASYCVGGDTLSICGDTWLNTTSIVAVLECLWSRRIRIGMITPDFAKLKDPVARRRVLGAHFALEDDTDCVISIVNMCGSHWTAFFVNLETKICTVFDPLQSEDRVRRLRKLIKDTVEPALNKTLQYRTYTDLQQNDSSSCGILCAMFLELMVEGKTRPKTIPPIGFFRARYMIMVSALLRTTCNVAEA